jgi:hypothetical protein
MASKCATLVMLHDQPIEEKASMEKATQDPRHFKRRYNRQAQLKSGLSFSIENRAYRKL